MTYLEFWDGNKKLMLIFLRKIYLLIELHTGLWWLRLSGNAIEYLRSLEFQSRPKYNYVYAFSRKDMLNLTLFIIRYKIIKEKTIPNFFKKKLRIMYVFHKMRICDSINAHLLWLMWPFTQNIPCYPHLNSRKTCLIIGIFLCCFIIKQLLYMLSFTN